MPVAHRAQHVVVIGGGDTAMEDALVLARTSASVTVVHRRDRFRASHALSSRVLQHPAIQVKWNATVVAFGGDASRGLTHVDIAGVGGGASERFEVGAAFVAIGHVPNTALLKGQLEMSAPPPPYSLSAPTPSLLPERAHTLLTPLARPHPPYSLSAPTPSLLP